MDGEVKHTTKVRRRSSFENLLSLFKKKPKAKFQSSEPRVRSGSADLTVTRSSLTSISLGKVERHHSDAGSQRRPSLTSLLSDRAARFKTKVMKQTDIAPSLGDLGKAVIAGHLDHKRAKKWTSLWCVVVDQTLFGFRSQESSAHPVIQINLRDCTLAASSKSIFKLCQFNAHSFYFRAHSNFDQWLQELERIVRAGCQFDASPKISTLSLTHPLNLCHSPARSPNLLARSLNFPSPSPRDPRKLIDSSPEVYNGEGGIVSTAKRSNNKLSQFKRKDSRHDPCLQEFWRNGAPDDGIFNKRLPGPHNEGLLMLEEDSSDKRQQQIRDLRRRSLSTGSLPVPLVEHLRHSAQHDGAPFNDSSLPKERKPVAPVDVAPGNVEDKIHEGWLMVLGEDNEWKRLWCVLSKKKLYAYNSPTESEAVDSVCLSGWTLLSGEEDNDMSLAHQQYRSIHMRSTDSPEWKSNIREATQRVSIEGLDLERGSNNEFEDRDRLKAASVATQRELQQEFVKLKKQQLLREILKQREQIVNQHQAQGGSPLLSTPEILVSPGSPNMMCRSCSGSDHESSSSSLHRLHDEQNAVVDLVKLKQRKVSTQLKVDSIHRVLLGKQGQLKKPKKKGFRLPAGLSKLSGDLASSDESLNEIIVPCNDTCKEDLQLQLKDLHRQLEHINNSILIKQSERLQSEGLNNRAKSRSTPFLCTDRGSSLEGSSAESSDRGSSESVNRSRGKQKMGIPELIDFRHRTKADQLEKSFDLRHSWSPNAFENFKISKGERKIERQSPMTCSQEFVTSAVPVQSEAPPLPPRRALGPKQKSMSSLSPRLPSSSSESPTDKPPRNSKLRISDDALAKIAAFEELLQENMII